MLVVHHLNESRSHRILWLLEELALPYEVRRYARNPQTRLAPPELAAVSPLGKAPALQLEDGRVLIESGAIIETVIRRLGGGRLQPPDNSVEYDAYIQWLHYAEGSAMLPLMLHLYAGRLGEAAAPLMPRIEGEIANHLAFLDRSLQGRAWLVGDGLTGADIQMSFVAEMAGVLGKRAAYPALDAWVRALQQRPAYRRAVERGGAYGLGR
ncbi:glutathione S-transferase family protein [Roseomonas haemaphysalidis]|uniref:Glutathione S-transferase n=1 Tax=Roseomonas haemaphysalidis TaxID=2768162 RepID=A0ABS3KNJ0_9PROT|nr:glutathione S-transferase [Roseomonas haemaphysalidis]MBO1078168.1 glutathione S-transferase [Roseomonas haemaphysalidis]